METEALNELAAELQIEGGYKKPEYVPMACCHQGFSPRFYHKP